MTRFIESITPIILKAGELTVKYKGKVANIEKDITFHKNDSKKIKQRARAKTKVDEKVQEMILQCVIELLGLSIKIDAEEDTPSKKLFVNSTSSITVVIDPIDGTLEYVRGGSKYSTNVGIIEDGRVLAALVYYPENKRLYLLDENKDSFCITYNERLLIKHQRRIKPPASINKNTIYVNNRVPKKAIINLRQNGFKVIEDDGKILWPDALLKCLSGDFTTSIFHSPQTRDVLLGAFIQNFPNGYMIDWKGTRLTWPAGGRIPNVIFGLGDLQEKIIKCLSKSPFLASA